LSDSGKDRFFASGQNNPNSDGPIRTPAIISPTTSAGNASTSAPHAATARNKKDLQKKGDRKLYPLMAACC